MSTSDTNTSASVEPPSAKSEPVAAQPAPTSIASNKKKFRWRPALIIVGALLLVFVIVPRAFHAWHTVSTDDAYVNSHVTFVAPRVIGQVARVLVDDNNRVKKGDVLVDSIPSRIVSRSRSNSRRSIPRKRN